MSDSDDQDKTRLQRRSQSESGAEPAPAPQPKTAGADVTRNANDPKLDPTVFGKRKRPSDRKRTNPPAVDGELPLSKGGDERTITPVLKGERKAGQAAPPPARSNNHDILKGRFILERVLGSGGMGVVYKARDLLKVEAKDRDPFVAIKVLGEEFKSHPEAFIALQRESRKTQRIAHPNIVNVYDFDKDDDTVFMTMEYLEGTPLDKLIRQYKATGLPCPDVWPILEGICSALAYAHVQNIIHSDLKPGNIFVTNHTVPKVFDFGIARAVAKAEHEEGHETDDRTLFDAGNLGALTPAYASLEMLEGEPPDVRDDIYALGCITYELFTGAHPFKRKNAKEAKRAGMKPPRIEGITKNQWRTIEKALAFERENRVDSVKEYWQLLSKKYVQPYKLWFFLLVLGVVGGVAYEIHRRQQEVPPLQPQFSEDEFRSEIEYKIRVELVQKNIDELLNTPTFDERWENALWKEVQSLAQLLTADVPQVVNTQQKIYLLYTRQIEKEIGLGQFELAKRHVVHARRYSVNTEALDQYQAAIEHAIAEMELQQQAELDQQRSVQLETKQQQAKEDERTQQRRIFDTALANVNEQLLCNKMLDMDDFAIAIKKLRDVDAAQYRQSEAKIVQGLATCIQKIGRNFPSRAASAKEVAVSLFPGSSVLRGINIASRDPCSVSLAGLGARGKRTTCQDVLSTSGEPPELVVIPAQARTNAFAIGRYEVTVADINHYCQFSSACDAMPHRNTALPVTNIPLSLAQGYLTWLSNETGRTYRLPSHEEWRHAARADGRGLDANHNCTIDSRGIKKGGALVNASIGQQNGWGLVNYVGNAREWVTGRGQKLLAVGGSYATLMDECGTELQAPSKGTPDDETGFRVVRELASDHS